jgi:Ca2+-binding EF-hand superfamily protein
MDNFLRLTDKETRKQDKKWKVPLNSHVTTERIEKLKKTFQPFWMRGMIPYKKDADETLNAMNSFNHV